jgi:hypothetical protein
MRLANEQVVVEVGADGRVQTVHQPQHPDRRYLAAVGLESVVVEGVRHAVGPPQVVADEDEVELRYHLPSGILAVVRHSIGSGWTMRLALDVADAGGIVLDDVVLDVRPAAGNVAWSVAAGVRGAYVVLPPPGRGPVLAGVLQLGSVHTVADDRLHLGRVTLGPGGRYVVAWQWGWYDSALGFGLSRCPSVPAPTRVTVGEVVEIHRDDDAALVVSSDLACRQEEEYLELSSEVPGRFQVEQRSAAGTVRIDLEWVPALADVLGTRVDALLSQPRTASGVVRLPNLAAALVVQHAVAGHTVSAREDAIEALELYTARLVGSGSAAAHEPDHPLVAAFLCGEFHRTGDESLLEDTHAAVLRRRTVGPGVGVGAAQVVPTLLMAGRDVGPVVASLRERAARLPPPESSGGVGVQAAALELLSVTGPTTAAPTLGARVAALGRHLGAGLPGEAVVRLPVATAAHLTTVMQLVPHIVVEEISASWGCSPQTLASRHVPEVVARLGEDQSDWALTWLLLALQAE